MMDPFLLALILCCITAVALEGSNLLESSWLAFIGLALLAGVAVLALMTWEV